MGAIRKINDPVEHKKNEKTIELAADHSNIDSFVSQITLAHLFNSDGSNNFNENMMHVYSTLYISKVLNPDIDDDEPEEIFSLNLKALALFELLKINGDIRSKSPEEITLEEIILNSLKELVAGRDYISYIIELYNYVNNKTDREVPKEEFNRKNQRTRANMPHPDEASNSHRNRKKTPLNTSIHRDVLDAMGRTIDKSGLKKTEWIERVILKAIYDEAPEVAAELELREIPKYPDDDEPRLM